MEMKKVSSPTTGLFLLIVVLLLCVPAMAKKKMAPTVTVCDLRTERMTDPMSIDTPTPRIGWRIESSLSDVMQTAAHVIVASTREKAEALEGDLWDAAIDGDQSQWVEYKGKPLRSNTRCYWRVQVSYKASGKDGETQGVTPYGDIALWNVGLLTESDWRGQWIGYDHLMPWDRQTEHSRLSSRYLRTEFSLDKKIRQATLYVCGLGMYECFINGNRVGDKVLTPAPTDYRKTVLYDAYDVTALLSLPSSYALGVVLGNGRYYTMQQDKKPWKITRFGMPTLRLNLIVEYEDGTRKVIDTNEKGWKVCVDGALRSNNEYDGETYDARRELTGWTKPGYDDSGWLQAERTALPQGTLRGTMMPGMKVVRTLKPKSVKRMGTDKWVVDMGQNMAGWLKLRIGGGHREGDSVVIRFAERLDSLGNIWTENFRHAQSTDRYYANGRETQDTWWNPVFTYHGFRYAEVSGCHGDTPYTVDDFVGEVVSDAMEETGRFVTTDTILNKVYHNAVWGLLSNYKGMPVDCPQRDERQPWLGDRTRGCYGEAFVFSVDRLYAKWVRDIVEAQREDGTIPDVAPAYWNYYSDNVTWPAALPFSLDMLHRHYGDEQPLQRYCNDVKRWLAHLKTQYQKEGLIQKDRYGDWCVPPEEETLIHSSDPARVTDGTLISTAYYYYLCKMMNDSEEARLTKEAFNRHFLTDKRGTSKVPGHLLYPDSVFYGNNTVTANLLPLVFGMIDDDYVRQEVAKQIVKKLLDQNQGTVTCGVIGIGWLMHALTDMGRSDMAWLLATNKQYPSWGYMAEHGATTIWELWNGDTASPKMNSGNHVMLLGDLLSWLYEDVAGIRSAAPGFKRILLKPDFSVDEMNDIDASYNSIYGPIVSRWKKVHGTLSWHIELPPNTTATAVLPDGSERQLGSGRHDLECDAHKTYKTDEAHTPQILCDEFLYESAPFPSCHSATIVETKKGDLVATYFGGTKERNPDVCIWVSRKPKGSSDWMAPVMVADGVELQPVETVTEATPNEFDGSKTYSNSRPAFGACFTPYPEWKGNWGEARVDGVHREACWNPVLFETPDGELQLYFKIGPNVANWKGWRVTSKDGGRTWGPREPLPDGIYGPIKNKPVTLHLSSSTFHPSPRIISPSSDERRGWKLYFELSDDGGHTWRKTDYVEADSGVLAIQPTIIELPDGRLEALCRTRSRRIGVTFSSDRGETWSRLQLIDTPNNNSGIDAVTLNYPPSTLLPPPSSLTSHPQFALICNDWPIEPDKQKGARTPLSILRSTDGLHWEHWVTLEDSPISQYSYPSIIQTRDGHLHAIYTWRRQRIKHVELMVK